MASEYTRLAAGTPLSGIDLSRYEELSPPPPSAPLSTLQSTLAQAQTSQTYLSQRLNNLNHLESTGKETWLASNEYLVSLLSGLEKELAETKEAIDRTVLERQSAQEAVKGEMVLLEKAWKDGVGRVLETEVAAEGLRGQILEQRRARGGG
jgi:pre-mRNA-splicing factor SPF27